MFIEFLKVVQFLLGAVFLIFIGWVVVQFFKASSSIPWTGGGKASERFRKQGGKYPHLSQAEKKAAFKYHWKYGNKK